MRRTDSSGSATRLEQAFERRFYLSSDSHTEHVKAKFSKGVLEVHTPKLPISKPHNRDQDLAGADAPGASARLHHHAGAERVTTR